MKNILAALFMSVISAGVFAGDLTGENVLGQLRIGAGSIRIGSEGVNWNDPDNCIGNESGKSSHVYLLESNSNFKEIYSAVLAARVAKTPVMFYVNGCETLNGKTYPVVSTMYL